MHVIIYYGPMGAGKNYQGAREADNLAVPFLDGDLMLPAELMRRVQRFQPLSVGMTQNYIRDHLFPAILQLGECVVAQALYRRRDREWLKEHLERYGRTVEFRLVRVPVLQNAQQLLRRPHGWRWVLYWALHQPFFQP